MNYYVDRIAHDIRIYSDEGQLLAVVEDEDDAYEEIQDDPRLADVPSDDDAEPVFGQVTSAKRVRP